MKQLFSLLIVALLSVSASYASESPATPAAFISFNTSYPKAQEIKWSKVDSYEKVNFKMDGQEQTAFFTQDGEWIATTRNIPLEQLPKALKENLKNEMNDFWITDLIIMSTGSGDTYYVQLENADSKLIKQSVSGKRWTSFTKR